MAQITRTGMHYGRLMEVVVKRREDDPKRLQVRLKFFLTAWFSPAEKIAGRNPWQDIQGEGQEITFFGELHGAQGGRNMAIVEMLSLALGWGGKSIAELQGTKLDGDGLYCQIDCQSSTYENKTRIQARWIYPETHVAEARGAADAELAAMDAEWANAPASPGKMVHGSAPAGPVLPRVPQSGRPGPR